MEKTTLKSASGGRGAYSKARYSNADLTGVFQQLPGSSDYENVPANYYSGASSTSGLISSGISAVKDVLLGLFGKGDKYQVQSLKYLIEEQQKTTYILWAIIGLVAVVATVLLIKKTK